MKFKRPTRHRALHAHAPASDPTAAANTAFTEGALIVSAVCAEQWAAGLLLTLDSDERTAGETIEAALRNAGVLAETPPENLAILKTHLVPVLVGFIRGAAEQATAHAIACRAAATTMQQKGAGT